MRNIIEALKDPKKRSLAMFGIYFIFFIFVFVVLNIADSKPVIDTSSTKPNANTNNLSAIENYKDMKSFSYKFSYVENGITSVINGNYVDNISLFNFNNNKYYLENNLIYVIDNNSYYLSYIEYNITKLFNSNLYNILNELKEESSLVYNDNKKEINYTLDSNRFYNYYFDTNIEFQGSIYVKIIEDNNYITNIVFDLTNLNISLNKIEIEYSNINNIKSLEFNKDNYNLESR